jgi:peptide deformylase
MHKVIDCFKENNPVINKKLRKVSVDEGLSIAKDLLNILAERKDGIGLAANQVGIDAAVAVVNVREPLILINPVITKQWDEIGYYEGCLSFPKKGVHTKRYRNVIIQSEQEEAGWYFSGVETIQDVKGSWEQKGKDEDQELRLLEAVCVQHEIDHLNGLTIMDREQKRKPRRVSKKWGRNEIVGITDGKDYKEIKYKKAKPLIDSGDWEIYIGGPIT